MARQCADSAGARWIEFLQACHVICWEEENLGGSRDWWQVRGWWAMLPPSLAPETGCAFRLVPRGAGKGF